MPEICCRRNVDEFAGSRGLETGVRLELIYSLLPQQPKLKADEDVDRENVINVTSIQQIYC